MQDKPSILLADDEAIIRRKVRMMLGDNFLMDEASTAADTLEAVGNNYDAILLDIVFPDGNGIEICREIKARDPHSTVIISSSMDSVDAWNDAFQAGADGYIEKKDLLGLDPRKIVLMICNLAERNRLRREAEERNIRQAELLSVLSHDVRAPFQALLGTIELLRECQIPPEAARNVETLHGCAREQLGFINSLLELLRLESKITSLRVLPMDINLPINQCMQGLAILASQKELQLETDLAQNLPQLHGDLGRIAQLVNNLVTNAIKFTPRGGKIIVATNLAERSGIMGLEIRVIDTGIGITAEEQEKIFQRFHRGREPGTEGERGSGLGLAICREIVQLHGGDLELISKKSEGTVAKAWFPLTPGGEAKSAEDPFRYHNDRVTESSLKKQTFSREIQNGGSGAIVGPASCRSLDIASPITGTAGCRSH
ncbi:MAG TPA: hybrid sensor histidine kinase/response regulator [Desulfomonilaceae bacterium]|nr:hybrid sensor histidine kinase/response regulator [Desulfomonilaceae bacterium]